MEKRSQMVGTERVYSSWADEVEKEAVEEEEEAKAQSQQISEPNPFGSARPREVILQERGIDWRKLDLHLHQSRQVNSSKENTPASVVNQNRRLRTEKLGFNQSTAIAVPPLRYPPRNMVASCFEVQQRGFQRKSSSNGSREVQSIGKASHENGIHMSRSVTVQSMEKGRNSRSSGNHGYRVNASGSLLGRPPVKVEDMQKIGVLRSKTLQGW